MTTPVTAQGPAAQGMPAQAYAQGFPPSLGIEQYLGLGQQYGGFSQQPFMQSSQFPGQQQMFGPQPQVHQIVQSLATQLLPIAQQVILPQVVATAIQQIQAQLQQLVAQQVNGQPQLSGWQPQFGQGGWQQPYLSQLTNWQQPQFGQPGLSPFGRPYTGSY